MGIKVFKFGGASVVDAESVKNVGQIIQTYKGQKLAVIVSATGKSTNKLEGIVNAYVSGDEELQSLLLSIKSTHLELLEGSGIKDPNAIADIMDSFVEIDWMIEDEMHDSYDYIYDQIVSVGEIVSTKILHYHLRSINVNSVWLDIRDVLFTTETHRDAKVDWAFSTSKINNRVSKLCEQYDVIVTQGFIGSTRDNHTTTLGREGSDYTGAIISYCIDAESMHIWKDVPGVMTGDPTVFENVKKIERMSYREAIEMTYYGAKVIHAKTIKPIQNKNIPLYVRPFNNPDELGTLISSAEGLSYPPIIVLEKDQCLVHISVKDFSFVAEHHISNIFKTLSDLRLKVNMMRNTAISFSLCIQYVEERIDLLIETLQNDFTIVTDRDLELITVRHYQEDTVDELKKGKIVLFEERLNDMIQMVVKDVSPLKRK